MRVTITYLRDKTVARSTNCTLVRNSNWAITNPHFARSACNYLELSDPIKARVIQSRTQIPVNIYEG